MEKEKLASRALGLIGCLTAGFELVGRHLSLVVLPVLLDLLLWGGPRVSIAPLVNGFVHLMGAQAVVEPSLAPQVQAMSKLLVQAGQTLNLLSLLGGIPVLTLPSLLIGRPAAQTWPLGEPAVWPVERVLVLAGWWIVLVPLGLFLGYIYLSSIAGQVARWEIERDGDQGVGERAEPSSPEPATRVTQGGPLGKLLRYATFAVLILLAQIVLMPAGLLIVSLIATIVPMVGVVVWVLGIGVAMYILFQLIFVVHGVLLGRRKLVRAVLESVLLVRSQFGSVMGLVLLGLVVYGGLGRLWSIPQADSWVLLIGIVANSCVATGLVAATFIFYSERVRSIPQIRWGSRKTETEQ